MAALDWFDENDIDSSIYVLQKYIVSTHSRPYSLSVHARGLGALSCLPLLPVPHSNHTPLTLLLSTTCTMTAPTDDEWEYEYDDVETEKFYIPIDLSNVPRGQKHVDSERRTGHPTLLKSRLRALNAQRGPQQDAAAVDNANGQEPGTVGEAQIIGLHTENPLVMYNGQLLSLQWASTIGTDMFFTKPDPDANSEKKPLRSLPNVDLLATSSAKLVARLGRLRPRDELFDDAGVAESATATTAASQPEMVTDDTQGSATLSEAPPNSFLARLNAAKAKRGDSMRLAISTSGNESSLVAEAAEAAPAATRPDVEDGGDVQMSGT